MPQRIRTDLDFTIEDWEDCRDCYLEHSQNPKLSRRDREFYRTQARLAGLEVMRRYMQTDILELAVEGDAIRVYVELP